MSDQEQKSRIVITPHALKQEADIQTGPQMLTGDAKRRLADSGVEFYITEAVFIPDAEHGSCWQFICEAGTYSFGFFMGDPLKEREDGKVLDQLALEYEALHNACAEGAVVGPYTLRWVERDTKQSFYQLAPATPFASQELTGGFQSALPF